MRRIISILLAVLMVFSTVAFAAPVSMPTVDIADETVEAAQAEQEKMKLNEDGTVTVTFTSDVAGVTLPYDVTVAAGATLDLNSYRLSNTADYLFAGWNNGDDPVGGTITVSENTTLTARWEAAYHETYGQLIASMDFENFTKGASFTHTNAATYGAVTSDMPKGLPSAIYFSPESATSYTIAQEDGNKYLHMYSTGSNSNSGRWNRIVVTGDRSINQVNCFPEGVYYLTWTTKLLDKGPAADGSQDTTNISYYKPSNNNSYIVLSEEPWKGLYSEKNKGLNVKYTDIYSPQTAEATRLRKWADSVAYASYLEGEVFNVTADKGGYLMDEAQENYILDENDKKIPVDHKFTYLQSIQAMPEVILTDNNSSFRSNVAIDDIKLYYKAPVEVKFVDAEGYAETMPENIKYKADSTSKYLSLTDKRLTSTNEDYLFEGWSLTEGGKVLPYNKVFQNNDFDGDLTLYAVWRNVKHEQYGDLLYDIDFENNTDRGVTALYLNGFMNSTYETSTSWSLNSNHHIYGENANGDIVEINGVIQSGFEDTTVVNRYARIQPGNTGRWPQLQVTCSSGTFAGPGYYTLVTDVKVKNYSKFPLSSFCHNARNQITFNAKQTIDTYTDANFNTLVSSGVPTTVEIYVHRGGNYNSQNTNGSIHLSGFGDGTEWITSTGHDNMTDLTKIKGSVTTTDKNKFTKTTIAVEDPLSFDGLYAILYTFTYNSEPGAGNDTSADHFYIDNLRMYFKPFTANVTVDLNGNDAASAFPGVGEMSTAKIVDVDALYAAYTADMWGDGNKFLGLSYEPDGAVITDDFYLTEDVTLYARWKTVDVYKPNLVAVEFDDVAVASGTTDLDYRKNFKIDVVFDGELGFTAQQMYDHIIAAGSTAKVFNGHYEYDAETYTYTFYCAIAPSAATFKMGGSILGDDSIYYIPDYTASYSAVKHFDDGENLIPNGDFTRPYTSPYTKGSRHYKVSVVDIPENDNYRLLTRFSSDSSINGYSGYEFNVDFQADKKYFFDLEVTYAGWVDDEGNVDKTIRLSDISSLNFWCPKTDGSYGVSNKNMYHNPSYLPGVRLNGNVFTYEGENETVLTNYYLQKNKFFFTPLVDGNHVSLQSDLISRMKFGSTFAEKYNAETDTWEPYITIHKQGDQKVFDNGQQKEDTDPAEYYDYHLARIENLGYYISKFVVKEAFDANFTLADGTALETRFCAKDVAITLPTLGEYPTLPDGTILTGWQYGDTVYAPGDEFVLDVASNVTLVAIAEGIDVRPTTGNTFSIRADGYNGIRFKASVTREQKAETVEYGFIVTRQSLLDAAGLTGDDLVFDGKVAYASGAAYSTDLDIDKIFEETETEVIYTGVFVGIPATDDNFREDIVARPYAKTADGTFYGDYACQNLLEVAQTIRDTDFAGVSESAKEYVQSILKTCGEPFEYGYLKMADAEGGSLCGLDAEGKTDIAIVDDPTRADNKVYHIYMSDENKKLQQDAKKCQQWTYVWWHDFPFEDNTTYEVSYKVLLDPKDMAGNDITDTTIYSTPESSIVPNFYYFDGTFDKDGNEIKNHTKGAVTANTTQWVSKTFTYTTSTLSDTNLTAGNHPRFGFYANPLKLIDQTTDYGAQEIGRFFYIDDVSIRVVE